MARALRFHGSHDKETFTYVGYNSRLDELQAAILRVLLPELDGWCAGRRAGADAYLAAGLAEHVTVPVVPTGAIPAWHLYAVTHPRADALLRALADAGVEARGYYRVPLHRQPAMAPFVDRTSPSCRSPTRSAPRTSCCRSARCSVPIRLTRSSRRSRARRSRTARTPPCASGSTSPILLTCSCCAR